MFIGSKTLIDKARCEMAEQAVQGGYTHIFFMDSDQTFERDTLVRLIEHDKDIVTGIYVQRDAFMKPNIYRREPKPEETRKLYEHIYEWDENAKLIEVDGCGAGCLLIKTDALKKMEQPYFAIQTSRDAYIGEDIYFCELAKKAGLKIYCDTHVRSGHMDFSEFTVEEFELQRDKRKGFFKSVGETKEVPVTCVHCGKEFTDTIEGELLYEFYHAPKMLPLVTTCPHCKKDMPFSREKYVELLKGE